MEEFIKKGKFDCIQIGQTKEWILHNFPDPDHDYSMSYKDTIWSYGSFEFFFQKNQLVSIYCEDLALNVPGSLKIDKWIFDEPMTLIQFIRVLNRNRISFNLTHSNLPPEILILTSNVRLCFYDQAEKDCNNFGLCSIILR
jgi:hypothetical protein